jgi:hypothetical protein
MKRIYFLGPKTKSGESTLRLGTNILMEDDVQGVVEDNIED